MTGSLTETQMRWLRGLKLADGYIPMSASELGNPEVSELQSLGLVQISRLGGGHNWRITRAGTEKSV
jgi:hypothetical protein